MTEFNLQKLIKEKAMLKAQIATQERLQQLKQLQAKRTPPKIAKTPPRYESTAEYDPELRKIANDEQLILKRQKARQQIIVMKQKLDVIAEKKQEIVLKNQFQLKVQNQSIKNTFQRRFFENERSMRIKSLKLREEKIKHDNKLKEMNQVRSMVRSQRVAQLTDEQLKTERELEEYRKKLQFLKRSNSVI